MMNAPDIQLAFDVGHSSIGWAVLQAPPGQNPELLGCGAVIFQADDCLASQRRGFRRQRRHIRATRLRIARLRKLLAHLGVLTSAQLEAVSSSSPWFLAARVLRGGAKLTWPELWDVLRWYAHNRGYDGNKAWSRNEADVIAVKEDTEKVERARGLLADFARKHGREGSMAEVWCDLSGLDPLGSKTSCALPGKDRPKGQNAAFPREEIEREVLAVLRSHFDHLPRVDETLLTALARDWQAIPCPEIRLPQRFRGGLLFGQLVPRFENRIIATCPITYEHVYQRVLRESGDAEKAKHEATKLAKVPAADCVEFFRYRWAMQVANVLVQTADPKRPRRLSIAERRALDRRMAERGALTKGEFAKSIEELTAKTPSNVKQMLLHPDADKALVVDRAQRELTSKDIAPYFATLPERLQKRLRGQLRHGAVRTLGQIRDDLAAIGDPSAFDALLAAEVDGTETKRSKKTKPVTRADILARTVRIEPVNGRAPHSRVVMRDVVEFIFSTDRHPAEEGGPLYRSEAIRAAQLQRAIDEQTNNHLVRHRLKILERLHDDLLKTYACDDKVRVRNITIEVNREVKQLSGRSAKDIAGELTKRLGNFTGVTQRLAKDLAGTGIRITPGLIRKARIADDLGWKCPYTGASYDAVQLARRAVDKDHIIPRSDRASDSLDSLVITFAAVNRLKAKRTATRFIEEEQGKPVPGATHLSIKTLANYTRDVEALETFKGHADDQRRKKNRKRMLLVRDYVEKEFTPGDLTKTSQLVRLGSQALERHYLDSAERPVITAIPGFFTGTVRKSWKVLGCLATANPQVLNPDDLDEDGRPKVRSKTEIRDISHLHHALDACTLAFARHFLLHDGSAVELLTKRRLNADDRARARALFGSAIEITAEGDPRLADLPRPFKEQIRTRLAERRVVQHLPREMAGMRAELNAWRVVKVEGDMATLRQRIRQPDGSRPQKPDKKEKVSKLVGLQPGKLHRLKAALVIADNFGLALDPEPTIIPHHHVWKRLAELKAKNGGKPIRVLRNGMLVQVPRGKFLGVWRVFSLKNASVGIMLDLGRPDVVRLLNKTEGHKINVLLGSLLRDGLEVAHVGLAGSESTPSHSLNPSPSRSEDREGFGFKAKP